MSWEYRIVRHTGPLSFEKNPVFFLARVDTEKYFQMIDTRAPISHDLSTLRQMIREIPTAIHKPILEERDGKLVEVEE